MMTAKTGAKTGAETGAGTGAKTGAQPEREASKQTERRREDLQVRYGAIGISAVAAAVRYAGDTKNQAYAPVVHRVEARFTEFAAA